MPTSANRRRPNKSVTEWVVFCLVFLAIGSYLAYFLSEDYARIEARERDRLTDHCNIVSLNLGRQFGAINAALAGIVGEIPTWRRENEGKLLAAQHLKALNNAMLDVRTLLVFDASGTVQYSDKPELVGKNFAERDYFQAVLKDPSPDTLYVRPPFTSSRGNWTINLARMVPDGKGKFDGLAVAALDAEEFKVLLNSVLYRADTKAALIHGGGVPFLMAPESKSVDGANLVRPGSYFSQHLGSGREVNVFSGPIAYDGVQRLIALQTIKPKTLLMDNPMVVAIDRPVKSIFTNWYRLVLHYCAMFAALAGLAGLSLRLYQSRRSLLQRFHS